MITTITAWLIKKGVGEQFAKPLIFAFLALVASGALLGLKSCYDSSVVENAVNEANIETLETKGEADENAADDRLTDVTETRDLEEGLNDAIKLNENGYPDDPDVRLACRRLLNDGKKPSDLPPVCGCSGRELCYGIQTEAE